MTLELLEELERRILISKRERFFHGGLRRSFDFLVTPDPGESVLNFLLEASDQFPVGGDQRLLGFDLGHDGSLCDEGREGNRRFV